MNWSELNRRLDERLEPDDALNVAKRFGLNPDQFSATPTLREMVQAGDLSLGDVARIIDPNFRDEEEPVEDDPVEIYRPTYLGFEGEFGEEAKVEGSMADSTDSAPEADRGVTQAEAEWLTLKFGLAKISAGTSLSRIVQEYDLDSVAVEKSLTMIGLQAPGENQKTTQRLVDLNNPEDMAKVYESVRDEFWARRLIAGGIAVLVIVIVLVIAGIARSCTVEPADPLSQGDPLRGLTGASSSSR